MDATKAVGRSRQVGRWVVRTQTALLAVTVALALAVRPLRTPSAAPPSAPQAVRVRVPPDCMEPERGHCFLARMDFGEDGDRTTHNGSGLLLFENGRPLGPAHALHEDIRRKGGGRYSHWTRGTLYFSTSDNTDPRTNGRVYEVASTNPDSTLGGLSRFPVRHRQHVEEISRSRHEYLVHVGGTLDMDNTLTLASNNVFVAFQNNVSLTIENVGDVPVVNPRLVVNDRGNWYTFDSLLAEFTRGATNDQEKAYLIWQNMRQNLYHQTPLFSDAEPHDPVKLLNVFGFNLCDDAGHAGCSLFFHAGLTGSKNRALNGHVQCEAFVDGRFEFLDVDMDCFYLDRENRFPVGGDQLARDHDLVRRELNYGPVVDRFRPSDTVAALFGPDDRRFDARRRGHEIAYTLRPGERVEFRWDNVGKYCCQGPEWQHRPPYFGNSKFVFCPRLTLADIRRDAFQWHDLAAAPDQAAPARVVGVSQRATLSYQIQTPYPVCGGTVRAEFFGRSDGDTFTVSLSLNGRTWKELWRASGKGRHVATVPLDAALDVHHAPAKYAYFVRVGLSSAADSTAGAAHSPTPSTSQSRPTAGLCRLEIETDVLAAPFSLPRLRVGQNRVVYWDATREPHRVRVTHSWKECDAVQPLPPVQRPTHPLPGAQVRQSIVRFSWPAVPGAKWYHLQVSRRPDFAYPYRTSFDVVIPTTHWEVPFTGLFSPDTVYYWRLRCRDRWGVWGRWSEPWTFTWHGPCVPVGLGYEQHGRTLVLHWQPNPKGQRPVRYEVYGSDEKGFSVHKQRHTVPGRGEVPGNFFAETTETSLVVVSDRLNAENANRVYYRVVAVDAHGTRSGCSDFVELPHPFLYSQPVTQARVGQPYRYQLESLRSLGDYQCRPDPQAKPKRQYAYRYWDVERNEFRLVEGPNWLKLDRQTGLLSGTPRPEHAGRWLVVVEVRNQFGRRDRQRFVVEVAP